MSALKFLLMPFAWLYGWVIRFRHWLFNTGILKSQTFDIPLIGVGNLSMGGTGKTPTVEYIIRLLVNKFHIATLSRGYGRQTKGFLLANQFSHYSDIGDEPLQYFKKFKKAANVKVAVDEKRKRGIRQLMDNNDLLDVILLDDVFQHRYVKPGLSILLTDFHKLYRNDYLLPVGSLRDTVSVAKNADIIIVTKSPKVLSPITRENIIEILKPASHQKLYFSYLTYGNFIALPSTDEIKLPESFNTILLFTGIANSYPLQEYLMDKCNELKVIDFPDHHAFKPKDLLKIRNMFDDIFTSKKILVTTEKDAMRLMNSPYLSELKFLPIFYVPVKIEMHNPDKLEFDNQILNYVRKNRQNSTIYKGSD